MTEKITFLKFKSEYRRTTDYGHTLVLVLLIELGQLGVVGVG